jgi:phosphoglycerol transferase MdoB-like AlkP superfamily enzyme
MPPQVVVFLCCFFGFVLAVLWLAAAAVFRSACHVAGLRRPNFFFALAVVFVTNMVAMFPLLVVAAVVGEATEQEMLTGLEAQIIWRLALRPIEMVVCPLLYAPMLGITVRKGLQVYFAELVITVAIYIGVGIPMALIAVFSN